tara:strand:- start:532 stop:1626 length:1095 start_codon:yes stop_codon:yes gene_type:complete
MTNTKKKLINKKKNKNKTVKKNNIYINSNFESGNIKHISTKFQNKKYKIILKIKNEPYRKSIKRKYQNWFYFKVTNVKKKKLIFKIQNIRNYDNDWKGFNVAISYDNKNWIRHKTKLIKNSLIWDINPKKSTIWFAYYPPYPFSKSKQILPNMKTIGTTKDKRRILMKKLGSGNFKVWVISGQHPGETINSWILEGFIKRILERKKKLFKKYTFYIIPNANPDGNVRGHWYLTSKGINLNRDWKKQKSPEVTSIKKYINKIGYHLVFDFHGDEGSGKHFLVSSFNNKHPLFDKINREINKRNRHFQLKNYYSAKYMKSAKDTLDDYTVGITVEGAMKHPLYNHKTLQDEPIQIGKSLADILEDL